MQKLIPQMEAINRFLNLLRISHWTKAVFVLLGVFYTGSLEYLPYALLSAFSFCLIASAVYIYNDFHDREIDRLHPKKCYRPLASGEVSLKLIIITFTLCLIGGLSLSWFVSSQLALLLAIYLLINLAYNHMLKNVVILDTMCIASGFLLRILAGTIGIGLPISWWLTLVATSISFFIALCKRRLEKYLGLRSSTRVVLNKYTFFLLDNLIVLTAVMTFIIYFLYTLYVKSESFYFLLTLPFAAIGLWRFVWLTLNQWEDNDDPMTIFFRDKFSRLNVICFLILSVVATQMLLPL